MAKRFIDTGLFKSPFVRSLEAPLKSLFCYIICDCSNAGIWIVDMEVASMYCGTKISLADAKKAFIETGKAMDLGNGKWFFKDFIEHQYPQGLSEKNPAHKNAILELKTRGLIDDNLSIKQTVQIKGQQSTSKGTKDMDKEKDMVMDEETVMEICPTFDDFWDAYDKKRGDMEKVKKKWMKLTQAEREAIMAYIPDYKLSQPDKQFRKDPETFLNNKSWNDEIIRTTTGQQKNGNSRLDAEYLADLERRIRS